MNGWNDQVSMAVAGVEGVFVIGLLIWISVVTSKLVKLKKAHHKLMGETGVTNMEDAMNVLHQRISGISEHQTKQENRISHSEKRLTALKGRIGVHRFNAFSDSGSDLSFSVAIVNDEQDGVVITGIHGREQTFLYAKPIDKGQSAYMLTPEEKTAISQASQKG